ncbi:MAG: hypothetical protein K940chlam9_01780 [Chlamydiae bacterium]|nr:hypothetical protein [Chlamydiota bacterium]
MLKEEKFTFLYGKSLQEKRKRFLTYLNEIPPSKIFQTAAVPPLLSVTVGGTVGGIVGFVGGPKGAVVGAGSGAGVGLIAGTSYATYLTRKNYRQWLKHYRSDQVLTEFHEAIMQMPELNEFICPLTKELIHFPMVDPFGHNYEKTAILSWIKEHNCSPISKKPLNYSDLRPNFMLMGRQAKCYHQVLEKEMEGGNLTETQQEGIQALLKDLSKQMSNCFDAENKYLHSLVVKGEISLRTYVSQLSMMAEIFQL